jgi:crotonobetainyl-CoA:carnitine CoA-transferase CaiB-like acyl-CoA transferase
MTYDLLADVRVLEIGNGISAPYCGKLLADMGAQVTKIEPPVSGDSSRGYGPFLNDDPHQERSGLFLYLNANKRGLTLDLSTPTGKGILEDLTVRSDVLVHNLHPREMDRVELSYEALISSNPALVMASVTPFGLTGPYKYYKAYDINLAAAGGICQGLGSADRPPLTFGTAQVGYFAGMAAASSVLMALLARDTSGAGGQHIDIAEVETMSGVYNGPEALMAVYEWRMTRRTGHHSMDFPYPNCILRCKDGYIFAGSPEGRQWRKLLELMGDPDWSRDPRFTNRTVMNNDYADEIDGYMEEWLLRHTKAELLELAMEHRIPLGPVRGFDEVRNDPSLEGWFEEIERDDTGGMSFPGPPYTFADSLPIAAFAAPRLGEHNEEVYTGELGFTHAQLVALYQTGII